MGVEKLADLTNRSDRLLGSGKIYEVEETAVFVCYQVLIFIINHGKKNH